MNFTYSCSSINFHGVGRLRLFILRSHIQPLPATCTAIEYSQSSSCGQSLGTVIWRMKYSVNLIKMHWKHSLFQLNRVLVSFEEPSMNLQAELGEAWKAESSDFKLVKRLT